MFVRDKKQESRLTGQSGINNVLSCTFLNLGSSTIDGGALCCTVSDSQLIVSESTFISCVGKSGGAVAATISTVDISKSCGNGCSNEGDNGYFAYIYISTSLTVSYLSMTRNEGKGATGRFIGKKQTIMNINTTYNKGAKESGYITSGAIYSTSMFINVASNEMNNIGINFHNGQNYYATYMNYQNCSFYDPGSLPYHVFIDAATVSAVFNNCFISATTYPIVGRSSPGVSISDSFFLDSFDISGVTIGSNVLNKQAKTIIFSLLNTKLCPAFRSNLCTRNINRRRDLTFYSFFYILLVTN